MLGKFTFVTLVFFFSGFVYANPSGLWSGKCEIEFGFPLNGWQELEIALDSTSLNMKMALTFLGRTSLVPFLPYKVENGRVLRDGKEIGHITESEIDIVEQSADSKTRYNIVVQDNHLEFKMLTTDLQTMKTSMKVDGHLSRLK